HAEEWRDPDSNRGHHDFQSCALPTELSRPGGAMLAASEDPLSARSYGNDGLLEEDRMTIQRQLFVLRHAKSSWDDPGLDDHERPLAPRGRRAVEVLNKHLRTTGACPEQVLCSSARRTRE